MTAPRNTDAGTSPGRGVNHRGRSGQEGRGEWRRLREGRAVREEGMGQ